MTNASFIMKRFNIVIYLFAAKESLYYFICKLVVVHKTKGFGISHLPAFNATKYYSNYILADVVKFLNMPRKHAI